jgi:hypothetical protein
MDPRGGPVPSPINFLHLDDIHPGIEAKLEYDPGACLPGAAGLVA